MSDNNEKELKYIEPFKYQLLQSFPFIAEDFDQYTAYGLFCKLSEKMNEVVANNNNLNDDMILYIQKFNQLKTYVETYLENLDVQDEINNKLNEMVEDGTMYRLTNNILANTYTELSDKIDDNYDILSNQIENIDNLNPIAVSSTEQMTDTTKLYLNTTNGYWYYYNGTNWTQGGTYQSSIIPLKSITPYNTTFMYPINLMPKNNYKQNYILNYNDGTEVSFAGASYCTDFYPIEENKSTVIALSPVSKSLHIYFYDDDYTFLSSTGLSNSGEKKSIPSGAKYFRVAFQNGLNGNYYSLYYYEDYINGENLINIANVKNNYIQFDNENLLYNSKKLSILPTFYNMSTPLNTYIKGNKITINETFTASQTAYKGFYITADFKVGDVLKLKLSNIPDTISRLLVFSTNNDPIASIGNNQTTVSALTEEIEVTITQAIYNNIKNNTLLLTFGFTSAEETTASFSVTVEIENDFYYYNDFVKYVADSLSLAQTKKVIAIGDSITALGNTNRGWLKYFNNIQPIEIIANTAVNSAIIKDNENTVYDGNPTDSNPTNNVLGNQIQKIINNSYETPDFIVISIGTNGGITTTENDIYSSYYDNQGNKIDISNVDRTTIAGAVRYAIEKLQYIYPDVPIFWCSPIQAANSIRNVNNINDWNKNLHLLCDYASIICVDSNLCGICGINETSGSNGKYLIDGLHPNESGAKVLGEYNARIISEYLK